MTITLDPDLEAALLEQAQRQGVCSKELALKMLRKQLLPNDLIEPQDDWGRGLRALASHRGFGLTDEQLSREQMYD